MFASDLIRIDGIVDSVGLKLVVQGQSETILSPSVALAVKTVTGTVFEQTSFTLTDSSTLQVILQTSVLALPRNKRSIRL